ncbi:SIR2 family protein [Qipengyuania sp. YIM B01966]|uniref:SIR2 family protein n=1 Tax=Qipengyuania sp. YIM B01966 TaxID=2778646 RepID=UPI0018F55FBC|nr:SIR2 family protein [Qipengyuania sp. YIM B01966]
MELEALVRELRPDHTILLFGAGSSIPSNAPTPQAIIDHLSRRFSIPSAGFSLAEFTELIEQRSKDRRRMITEVRSLFKNLKPTAGLLNLPIYDWKSIYTTNYDDLIEQTFKRKAKPIGLFTSNFDFGNTSRTAETRLYKIHGTLEKDVAFGDQSRMILTESDYNLAQDYREHMFTALQMDMAESDLVIIGSSLSDDDIKPLITRALQLNTKAMVGGRISLLMYQRDEARADLYRGQGINVVFGGIDDFFVQLAKRSPGPQFDYLPSDSIIENYPKLVPTVTDVKHQIDTAVPDVSRMFTGWPANYADINKGLTFERSVAANMIAQAMGGESICLTLVGASGVGKTTAGRQVLTSLTKQGMSCWEHRVDLALDSSEWVSLARTLAEDGRRGALFIDEAHMHLREVNDLVDGLSHAEISSLVIILASSRNHWKPRIKSPNIYKRGKLYILSKVDGAEIERLLSLVDTSADLAKIVETSFSGFSRAEKRRRLTDRCESDMFVCMRNIFASESFDNIILREFAELQEQFQDVYRLVAALENAGVKVHRQLIIRLLGIPMQSTMALLDNMTDIVSEYTINEKRHIYGWRGRHPVISAIIAKYKYGEVDKVVALYDQVIDTAAPSYDIEVRSLIELCNVYTGIPKLADKSVQNRLLRKIVSLIPGQRVPRHRLIRNLTDMGHYDQAQTEIRIFENDFKIDAPVTRMKIELMIARATNSLGILLEDRLAILEKAKELAVVGTRRHPNSAGVFSAYCKVGISILRYGGERAAFDDAIDKLYKAADRLADPEMNSLIRHFERLEANILSEMGSDQMEAELIGELE